MKLQTCEICDKRFIADYGYSLALHWLVTGHAQVATFVCHTHPSGQHWGCTPEHAIKAATKCLKEHMNKENLLSRHGKVPRYAEEDRAWAEKRGENFHIVKSKEDLHSILEDMNGNIFDSI
jgi:hypothetical protein